MTHSFMILDNNKRMSINNFNPETIPLNPTSNTIFELENFNCLVKIYDFSSENSPFKINEMFEFIGIFTLEEPVSMDGDQYNDDNLIEDFSHALPESQLLPRIHALTFKKISQYYPFYHKLNNLQPSNKQDLWIDSELINRNIYKKNDQLIKISKEISYHNIFNLDNLNNLIRSSLISCINNILVIDSKFYNEEELNRFELISEMIFLNMLSSITNREESTGALIGYLPLNIYGFHENDERIPALLEFLKLIYPKVVKVIIIIFLYYLFI